MYLNQFFLTIMMFLCISIAANVHDICKTEKSPAPPLDVQIEINTSNRPTTRETTEHLENKSKPFQKFATFIFAIEIESGRRLHVLFGEVCVFRVLSASSSLPFSS